MRLWKTCQKRRPKSDPKSFRNRSKSDPGGPKTVQTIPPRQVWGPSRQKVKTNIGFLDDSGMGLRRQNPSKIDRKRFRKAFDFWFVFGPPFWSIFDAFWVPKWRPKLTFLEYGTSDGRFGPKPQDVAIVQHFLTFFQGLTLLKISKWVTSSNLVKARNLSFAEIWPEFFRKTEFV